MAAVAQGLRSPSVVARLTELEADQERVIQEIEHMDEEIRVSTISRPAAQEVMAYWAQALDLWQRVSEDERKTLLQELVMQVEMKEKNKASMQLLPVAGGFEGQVRNSIPNGSACQAKFHLFV